MEVYFVTGASKGMGYELAKQLSKEGHYVVGISRSGVSLEGIYAIQQDLSTNTDVEDLVNHMFANLPIEVESFTLINNAGVIEPIGKVGEIDETKIAMNVAVNLTAPMMLSSAFIRKVKDFKGPKRIANISSGAGRKPYEGWGSYCATKAGLDHFSRVVALEQQHESYPVKIVSIAPGIIDTGMQEKIRSSSEEEFPLIDRFKDYKEKEMLSAPSEIASKLISFIKTMDTYDIDPILDIRNL